MRRARQLAFDSRGQVGRAVVRRDRGIRSAENGGQFRERQLASKVTSLTTRNESRQRGLIRRSGDDHRSPAASNAATMVWLCPAVGRLAGTAAPGCTTTYGAVPTRAVTSGSGPRTASRAPSSSGSLRRWPVRGCVRTPADLRYVVPQIKQRARVVLANCADPGHSAIRSSSERQRRLVIGGQHECSVEAPASTALSRSATAWARTGGGSNSTQGASYSMTSWTPAAAQPPGEAGADGHRDLGAGGHGADRWPRQQHITEAVESSHQNAPQTATPCAAHHDLLTWRRTADRSVGATAATWWA